MLVDANITGGTSKSRSLSLSNQRTLNMYPEASTPASRSKFVLQPWPGQKVFSNGVAPDRGIFEHKGTLYQVAGPTLYSLTSDGTRTSLGSIAGSEKCIFDGIGDNVVIVVEGKAYQYDGTSVSEITDNDLETPDSCAHLNQQIIFQGDDDRWVTSDVGDATSIQGLNYATAESNADNLVRVFVHNQILYLAGEKTIEPWWNSGQGNPPFDRINEGIMQIGLAAKLSMASNDKSVYFLGDDKNVYILQGTTFERISSVNIANEIQGFDVISDAEGACITFQGQNFYVLTFPNEERTFAYNESVGRDQGWFELSSNTSETSRYNASSFTRAFGKNLVTDTDGNIHELDPDTYDEFGDEIIRYRQTGPIHGGAFGAPGKRIEMNRFEAFIETGVGTVSGEGLVPQIMLDYSDDGGRTWSTERWQTMGEAGEFIWKVEWHKLGSFHNRIIRLKCSDPVYFCIHHCAIDVAIGI